MCEIIGGRQYPADLEQGGLEIPRKLSFICDDEDCLATISNPELPLKKIKLEPVEEIVIPVNEHNENNDDIHK